MALKNIVLQEPEGYCGCPLTCSVHTAVIRAGQTGVLVFPPPYQCPLGGTGCGVAAGTGSVQLVAYGCPYRWELGSSHELG